MRPQRGRATEVENLNRDCTYSISASRRQGVGGMNCLEAKVMASKRTLNGSTQLELTLRVVDRASDVLVELCDTRGGARLMQGLILAEVGESFELFFRLAGTADTLALVELCHTGTNAGEASFLLDGGFPVTSSPHKVVSAATIVKSPDLVSEWLLQFQDRGVRLLFEHLAAHGVVTESEAANMLGGHRELRRFARQFEDLAAMSPFGVRIETIAGVKRYVREGAL